MTRKKLSNATVLVTGAGGFIGSHLCELCLQEGARVRAFVRYNSRSDWGMLEELDKRKLRNIQVIAADLRDPEAVRNAVRGCDIVFHLGALIGIPYSYANPSDVVSTNVLGTLHVLQAARECGINRVIQTSTSEVYGTACCVPMDEDHRLAPQSPYAASKIGSDMLAWSYYRAYGLPVTILRPFNTYGPRQSPRAVIPAIIIQALGSNSIRLGSIEPRRDLTFVADTARGFIAAAVSPDAVGQVIQLGSQTETAIVEIVRLVGRILHKRLNIRRDSQRVRPATSEVNRLLASNQKAAKLLGWHPEVMLPQGLERTIRWFENRSEFYRQDLYHI